MSRGEPCVRACERRADGVALLRHRRGPSRARGLPPPRRPRSARAARDRGRSSRRHRLRSRARRRAPRRESGSCARGASAPAGRAPVRRGRAARCRSSPNPASVPAAPPSCAASRSLDDLLESHACLDDRRQPAGGLEAERRRHGVLQECPGDHQRLAVIARERRGGRRHVVGFREHERERAAARRASRPCRRCPGSSRRGARSAPPRRRPSPRERAPAARRGCRQRGLRPRAARSRSARGRRRRRSRSRRAPARMPAVAPAFDERPLGVEHCLEPRPRRDGGPELGGDEEAVERRHAAIVVVHGSPAVMARDPRRRSSSSRSPSTRARAPPA